MADHIAVDFVGDAAVPVDDLLHLGKVRVEDGRDFRLPARTQLADDLFDPVKVGKDDGYRAELAPLAASHAPGIKA